MSEQPTITPVIKETLLRIHGPYVGTILADLIASATLNTNEYGDNVSVTIPIEAWREAWK